MKRKLYTGMILLMLCMLCTGCKAPEDTTLNNTEMERYSTYFFDIFDTQTTVIGYAQSQEDFDAKAALIQAKLEEYHRLYDIYYTYDGINNIKTINDHAGVEPVAVDQEIINLLKMSQEMYTLTSGKVNVAMGSVLSIWHEYRDHGREHPETAKLPVMEDLMKASEHMDIQNMMIDEEAGTVYLADPEMSLDVGGIGKGYAAQKVAEYAKEIGLANGLISVGGNACAIGEKQDGSAWKIGVENPDRESDDYVAIVNVKDTCVVTSGDYQRYYEVDGMKYCHIIHPETLMPATNFSSVTIVTADSGWADALSTAVFNMTLDEGLAFINGLDGVESMWVEKDGTLVYSDGFEAMLDKE